MPLKGLSNCLTSPLCAYTLIYAPRLHESYAELKNAIAVQRDISHSKTMINVRQRQ